MCGEACEGWEGWRRIRAQIKEKGQAPGLLPPSFHPFIGEPSGWVTHSGSGDWVQSIGSHAMRDAKTSEGTVRQELAVSTTATQCVLTLPRASAPHTPTRNIGNENWS